MKQDGDNASVRLHLKHLQEQDKSSDIEQQPPLCNFTVYCKILFIRGDPIFVVFVVDLANEFTIPRIRTTTVVPQTDTCTLLNKGFQYLHVFIHI